MCRRVNCSKCSRPTYVGCGAHIEQVLGDVPPSERCRCREEEAKGARTSDQGERRSWLSALLGRRAPTQE